MMAEKNPEQNEKDGENRTPLLEWISAAVGLLITLGMLGFIGWQAWTGADEVPPMIEVSVRRITAVPGGHVVEVTAKNLSPATAAAVVIEGELRDGQRVIATSEATLSYVPGHSERQGGLFFEEDPRAHDLELRALGYARP